MSRLDRQASSMPNRNKSLLSEEEIASDHSFPGQHKTLMPWTLMPSVSPPIERAKHIKYNKCFICHKVGCHTKNHPQDQPHNQGPPHPSRSPAQIRATTTSPATVPTLKPKLELALFVGSLERKGTTKEEILWVLTTCFTEEDEGKVKTVATTKVKEVKDF